jgi:hypothetical protein
MRRNIKLALVRRLARWTSPLAAKFEKRKIALHAGPGERHQPVFIVGAPRTGSTILYQALTDCLDTLYIDNLAALFSRSLYFGLWLSRKLYGSRPHHCYRSVQGDTRGCGLHGPSEGTDFWYRWLPRQHHYIGRGDLSPGAVAEIRQNLFASMNRYDRPLLLKNLAMGQRLGLIADLAPRARFIWIKREPLYTAQSILLVKRQRGQKPHDWWSIMPRNYRELLKLDGYQQVVRQIFFLEKQILADRHLFPAHQFITVHYRDLCCRTGETVERLRQFIDPGIGLRKDPQTLSLPLQEERRLEEEDFRRLRQECGKIDWENYEIK